MLINKYSNKGSALLSALFIMTLVAIAATAISTRLQLEIYRARLAITGDKLYLAAQIVPFWALSELANPKAIFTQSDARAKVLDLPIKLSTIYPATLIKGELYDLQARFNLNNVSDKRYQQSFQELLKNTVKKLDPSQRDALTLALISWVTRYSPGQNEANLEYYLKLTPPYYPSHQLMQNISEFRMVRGVNSKIYNTLKEFIIALPELTPININTASKPVLMSLGFGLNDKQVNEIIAARGKKGLRELSKINPLLEKFNVRSDQVTIESQYFMSIAFIRSDDFMLTLYSILKRNKDKNGKISVGLISESLNAIE